MSNAGKQLAVLVFIASFALIAVFFAGRGGGAELQCLHCMVWEEQTIDVVLCETRPPRCPAGPVLWRDVLRTPDRGGFTVTIPEGVWRIDWEKMDNTHSDPRPWERSIHGDR